MAIDLSGQDILPEEGFITIEIQWHHPLLLLAKILPWQTLIQLVVRDLKQTSAQGQWWMGRKIKVRMHLGAYLLQRLYNLTDRKLEYQIRDNAAFRLFCGWGFVDGWHAPDHTKVAEFRNRLSPETHRHLANALAQAAVHLGFGDPSEVDFDSTVQEANISYPSDASLMTKLGAGAKAPTPCPDERCEEGSPRVTDGLEVDMKAIKKKARDYFFIAKNKGIEIKREVFKNLHKLAKQQMRPVVEFCETLTIGQIAKLPWNIKQAYDQIKNDAWRYLDPGRKKRQGRVLRSTATKDPPGQMLVLSFHAKELACIKKGKAGKEMEFGRVFQLGRIKGNFIFILESSSVKMNDKKSFIPLLKEHADLFGEGTLETAAADKGYWSAENRNQLHKLGKCTEGLQIPAIIKQSGEDRKLQERLRNRRAGIEPLIGHIKQGGQLGRSRMKSDRATLAAGYGSVLGMNLRQLIRYLQGKMKIAA